MGARKGRITVEFLSVNDLERIVGIIADGLGSASAGPNVARGSAEATAAAVTSQATAAEALAQRRHVRFDDLTDLDLEGIRRATDLSDLDD